MTIQQMAALAGMVSTAGQAGLTLVGGVKALSALFGMREPTPEEQAAITALVIADATRRAEERKQMAGL